jgi:hypothetical protein
MDAPSNWTLADLDLVFDNLGLVVIEIIGNNEIDGINVQNDHDDSEDEEPDHLDVEHPIPIDQQPIIDRHLLGDNFHFEQPIPNELDMELILNPNDPDQIIPPFLEDFPTAAEKREKRANQQRELKRVRFLNLLFNI